MDLGDLRNQPKLVDQRPRLIVRRLAFELVPIERLTVGNGLEQIVEIV
jgi:hypothetical protein